MKTDENIYETFVRTVCVHCKNRTTNLCEIKKDMNGEARCMHYEKNKEFEGYKEFKGRLAEQSKPLMKGIVK